jgi:hypothetical protein
MTAESAVFEVLVIGISTPTQKANPGSRCFLRQRIDQTTASKLSSGS